MPMAPVPTEVHLHSDRRVFEIHFEDGKQFELSYEFLRVYSPSAEVRGHSPEEAVLQTGKRAVGIEKVEPVGNYALGIYFDDGHKTGIYTWEWLYELGVNHDAMWQDYLAKLSKAGASRDAVAH